jgi:hypothetical protein
MPLSLFAQTYSIKGRVIDNEKRPVESATIVVVDTVMIQSGVSDRDGIFEIRNISSGKTYLLKINCLGFKQYIANITIDQDIDLGDAVLQNSTEMLDEIVITVKSVESFADRKIYRLTEIDRNSSTSALDVMKIIPKILMGANDNLITVRGDQVKILINGINALESDLAAIAPNDVLRIEHYENPPARFANLGLGAVINVITKKRTNGGTVAVNLQNALTTGFGNDLMNVNYNHNNTQLGFKYSLNYRDYDKRILNESLDYHINDVYFSKNKTGLNSPYEYQIHQCELNFINLKENNYTFAVNVSLNKYSHDKRNKQEIEQLKPHHDTYIADGVDYNTHLKPAIDLYFNKILSSNQDFTVNIVGSYYDAQMRNKYHEYSNMSDTVFFSLITVNSDKYSIMSDAVYSCSFGINKLAFGLRDIFSVSQQKLTTIENENISSTLNELYAYSELTGEIKQITYALSIGLNYNYFDSYDLQRKYSNFYIRPALNVKYQLDKKSDILFNYQINTSNPSISNLSNNPVLQDVNIAYSGNPDLKPFASHSFLFSYSLYSDYFLFISDLAFDYSKKPILPYFVNRPDYILQTFENLFNSKRYNLSIFAQWFPFKTKWLRLRTFAEAFRNEVEYNDDTWFNNDFRIIPSIIVSHKKWNMNLFYQTKAKVLDGQLLRYSPSAAYIEMSYKPIPKMSLLFGWRYPFYKAWESSTKTHDTALISRYTIEKIKNNANMIYLQFVYNFSFGEPFKSSKKKMIYVDEDSGILKQ